MVEKAQVSALLARRSSRLAVGLCAVLAVSLTVIFHQLGGASLFGDESIYAETSRESVERGAWLPLYKATGQLFPNKPPAKILLVTACFEWLGESEFSARLPDAIFGVLTIAAVYVFAARRLGVAVGLLAAVILLGCEGYLCEHGVRESVMDSMLTFLAFVLCVAWINVRENGRHRLHWWLGAALAVLVANVTKNMVGVLFAFAIVVVEIILWIVSRQRPRPLLPAFGLLAVAITAGGAYFAAMMVLYKGDFATVLYEDLVVRASEGVDPVHIEGALFYLGSLGRQFSWWLVFLIPAAWRSLRSKDDGEVPAARFLALWSIIMVAGFSLSVSKLPWYIYPMYPQLAVVIAFGAREVAARLSAKPMRIGFVACLTFAAAIDLASSWKAVQADIRVVDEQRFVRAYSQLESAALAIDANAIKRHGRLRSWSRFYLEGAPNAQWFERSSVSFAGTSALCLFVATSEPWSYLPTAARPWHTIGRLRQLDSLGADIWIVGTCDLDLPWVLDRDAEFSVGLVFADGFEGGDLRGWGSSDDRTPGPGEKEAP